MQNKDDPPLCKLGAPPIPEGEKPENFQGEDTESANADEKEEERFGTWSSADWRQPRVQKSDSLVCTREHATRYRLRQNLLD